MNLSDQPNYRMPWEEGDLRQLAELIADGKPIKEIALEMGRTQEAVRNRAWKSGLLQRRRLRG